MRINVYLALATGQSRRSADQAISSQRVKINGKVAELGDKVQDNDLVELDGVTLSAAHHQTVMLNKPVGYVCSRNGQGSPTIYDLLPANLRHLKPVGRLDKDSSGLILLTNNGQLANQLTHPSFNKQKIYQIKLDKILAAADKEQIEAGVELDDGISRLQLDGKGQQWTVIMGEGRNRQIRRTFSALGYNVIKLDRTQFGDYKIKDLTEGEYLIIS